MIISSILLLITLIGWITMYKLFKKEAKIIYIPINTDETEETLRIESKIFKFLAIHYSNANLKLHDLQIEFGRTTVNLSKIIKDETKLSFPKYLRHLRLSEAKRRLLKGEHITISELGYLVGFNSPSNFIRVFKEEEGMSPKKFAETFKDLDSKEQTKDTSQDKI